MGAFDDLIPGQSGGGAFDDLIPGGQQLPQMPAAPAQTAPTGRGPFSMLAPEPMGQKPRDFTMDDAVYIAQSPARGLGNLVSAPADLTNTALNLLSSAGTGLINLALPDETEIDAPQLPLLSPQVRGLAADTYEAAGGRVVPPEDVGMTTRIGGNAIDLAVQGAAGGAGLSAAAGRKAAQEGVENLGPMLQAYAKKPLATPVVDTAAGAGAGTADQIAQENGIENPFVRFLLAGAGGYGGARTTQAAIAPTAAAQAVIDRVLPAPTIAPDNVTGVSLPVSRNTEQATAKMVQESATDPVRAAADIKRTVQESREMGWTPPTSGQASDDPGLLLLEKRARLGNPSRDIKSPAAGSPAFVERDRAVQGQLAQSVDDLGPAGANPRVPTDKATADARAANADFEQRRAGAVQAREGAQSETAQQQALLAKEREDRILAAREREQQAGGALEVAQEGEAKLGAPVQANLGGKTSASETLSNVLGEAKAEDSARKSALYRDAERLSTDRVDARPYAAEVAEIQRKLQPLASTDRAVANAMPDFAALLNPETGQGAVGVRDLIQMLPRLSAAAKAANANMRGDVAEAIGRIGDKIKGDLVNRAKAGDPAALKWSEAEANFRTQFAPKYREGVGAQLDQAERRGQPVPPSAQAGMFLKPRGGGKEAAADLQRILKDAPSAEAGQKAARDYVMADLATLVNDKGMIQPNRLRAWMGNNSGMLSQLLNVQREVNKLMVDVVNGREATNATKKSLDRAVADRKGAKLALDRREKEVLANAKLNEKQKSAEIAKIDTERATYDRDLQNDAIRHLIDADPRNAVQGVLRSRDPERAMTQIADRLKGDKPAVEGWKRAVSDWLYDQVKQTGAPDATGGLDPVSLNKMSQLLDKHGSALSKVFSPQEMNVLRRVQKQLDVLSRKGLGATTGSQTAENLSAMNLTELVMKQFLGNLEGGGQMRRLKLGLSLLPGTPKGARVDRLIERAMLDPELMQHLLTVPVKESMIPSWNRTLTRLIAARNIFAGDDQE